MIGKHWRWGYSDGVICGDNAGISTDNLVQHIILASSRKDLRTRFGGLRCRHVIRHAATPVDTNPPLRCTISPLVSRPPMYR